MPVKNDAPFVPLKITFTLDGTGVYYDPNEPPMIDALIAWEKVTHMSNITDDLQRDDIPADIPLPLKIWRMGGTWGYHASALFPEGDIVDSLQMWRKKFRQNRIEMIGKGTPSLVSGVYREYNHPLPLIICQKLVGWCVGNRQKVRRSLNRIKSIGKKRALGKGKVVSLSVEHADADYSLIKDGLAMRYLPFPGGLREVRMRPPYWNNTGRIESCEILSEYRM